MSKHLSESSARRNAWNTILGHTGALVAVIFWGLSFVSTKVIMDNGGLSPTEAYIYRFTIAYALLLIISHRRFWCNNLHDELMLVLCGISGGSIYFIAENTALKLTLVSNVSLLSSMSPLVTILLVAILYKNQRPGIGVIIGSIIAFLGVVCVIFNSMSAETQMEINPVGDLIALSSALCWAVYSLVLKSVNATYDALFITRKTFFYGVVTALPFLLFEPHVANPFSIFSNIDVIGNLIFLALGASIIAYYFWSKTVEKMGAVKANNYLYLQPIITLLASALLLGEPITALGIIGFFLILFGLWVGDYITQTKLKRKDS